MTDSSPSGAQGGQGAQGAQTAEILPPARRRALTPTSIYPHAVTLSIRLRWLAWLGGVVWVALGRGGSTPALAVLAAVAVYNVMLWRLNRRERHPALALVATLDLAAITGFLAVATRPSAESFLVFLFFTVILTLAYDWWGAFLSTVASAVGIGAVWAFAGGVPEPIGEAVGVVGALGGAAIALAFVVRRHEEVYGRLARVTIHDRVTGLYNRRHFADALDQLHRLSVRGGWPYALLLVDVDGLDDVNKKRGRAAGDRLLRLVGREIKAAVRGTDVVARFENDEFAVALPEADLASAERVAEKVRRRVAGLGENLTVTIGVAELPAAQMDQAVDAVAAAYRALAAAKAQGGGRIGTEAGQVR